MQELDQYRFDVAERLLAEAQSLDPASTEIAASAEALADARDRFIEAQRRDEDARRAQTRVAAQRLAALQEGEDRSEPAMAPPEPGGDAVTVSATPAETAGVQSPAAAPSGPPPGAALAPVAFVEAQPLPLKSATDSALQSPVAVSSLTRTRYVAPKYPRSAERRNQSGWVDVVFTVDVDGTTKDIEIRNSEPGDVFVGAAVRAVEKWEFEPVLDNGVPVERRANIRMMFAIE